jgi:flagellar motor switch protein FliG
VRTGEEKAALLLRGLPKELAEKVLAGLGRERANRARAQMEEIADDDEGFDEILEEFDVLLRGEGSSLTDPVAAIRATEAYKQSQTSTAGTGDDSTQGPAGEDPLAPLRGLEIPQLVGALKGEHTRTVSVVLNYLDTPRAGAIMRQLSPEVRREVTVRLGQTVTASKELLERIAQALVQKASAVAAAPAVPSEDIKIKRLADMLRILEKPDRMESLAALEESDAETAAKVKELLYQFEDLLRIEDRSIQKLLAEIDSKNLGIALKGTTDEIRDKVMKNLSKRAKESLEEEMEFLGTVTPSQIQESQKMVVDVIQRLDQAGELVMTE